MDKKIVTLIVICFGILYPAISVYLLHQSMNSISEAENFESNISAYQLSVWLSWVVLVILAIYYKWTTEKNVLFNVTYAFLLFGFGIYGYYVQEMVNMFQLDSGFTDNYSFGVFTALSNLAVAGILTGFLQASVWWFTRRWHRR